MLKLVIKGPAIQWGPWLRVPVDALDLDRALQQLRVPNPAYWEKFNAGLETDDLEPYLPLYRYEPGDKYIDVPRNYHVPYNQKGREMIDFFSGPVRVGKPLGRYPHPIVHNIKLRDEIQAEATAALQVDRTDKILSLSCGKGKTVVSLHAAAEQRLFPCLVIVHTNALMGQWKDAIRGNPERGVEGFYRDHKGNRIRVGHIQQNTQEWKGYPIAVAMLHTLLARDFPPEFYNYWRLIISDETHRLGAQYFMQALSMFRAERWGLSATLERYDGMHKAIQMHLGRVVYQNLEQPLVPKVCFVRSGFTCPDYRLRTGRPNMAKIANHISYNTDRNEQVSRWIRQCVEKGRTILVLGERIAQLESLYKMCTATSKALHIGAMNQEERDEALTKQVVFATQHLAKEGLDRPAFDTLFILVPFAGEGRLRQSAGRILRIKDGKKQPLVFIWEDESKVLNALCNKMYGHSRRLGWEIMTINGDRNAVEGTRNTRPHTEERNASIRRFGVGRLRAV